MPADWTPAARRRGSARPAAADADGGAGRRSAAEGQRSQVRGHRVSGVRGQIRVTPVAAGGRLGVVWNISWATYLERQKDQQRILVRSRSEILVTATSSAIDNHPRTIHLSAVPCWWSPPVETSPLPRPGPPASAPRLPDSSPPPLCRRPPAETSPPRAGVRAAPPVPSSGPSV